MEKTEKEHLGLAKKVIEYTNSTEGGSRPVRIKDMRLFAPSVVCVHDNWGEFDTFFDAREYTLPYQGWKDNGQTTEELKNLRIGVLSGVNPRHKSFEEAFEFAKTYLKPNGRGPDYFERPLELDLEFQVVGVGGEE